MISNQFEFNKEFSRETKEIEEIEIEDEKFEGQLTIEDYSELKILYLQNVKHIDKITIKNLTRLQKITIWDCNTKELVIENCPQIVKLNLRNNLLVNLDFLKDFDNLEELKLDGNIKIDKGLEYLPTVLKDFSYENTKLVKLLKPYQGDWEIYKKELQELIELSQKNPYKLLEEINELKEKELIGIESLDNFKKKHRKLKGALNFIIKEEELKSKEIDDLFTNEILENIKEQKENLYKLQKIKRELEAKLEFFEQLYQATKTKIEKKEEYLKELRLTYLEKFENYKKEKMSKKLGGFLDAQTKLTLSNDDTFAFRMKESLKEDLLEEEKLSIEELETICLLQEEITKLKQDLQKNLNHQEKQINQIINNYGTISG